MPKFIAFILVMFFGVIQIIAQDLDFSQFKPLKSKGELPLDFLEYYIKSAENDPNSNGNVDFEMMNTVEFGNLFASGKVMFNDPLSVYAKKVLDTLLHKRKEVRSRLRVFTLRSSTVNAYTTNDGKIFITTGMYARLKSEAELAFVLSHEVVHYINKHAFENFVFKNQLEKRIKPGNNNRIDKFEDVVLSRYLHTREKEYEADKIGLNLFLESEYSYLVVDSVFELLDHSLLPVFNIPFERSFFETDYLHIRDKAWLNEKDVLPQELEKDFKEVKSTHPSSISRKKHIQQILEDQKLRAEIRKLFLFSEKEFDRIRTTALFELAHILLLDKKYEEAIYHSFCMLKRFPGNSFLRRTSMKSFCAMLNELNLKSMLYDRYKKMGYISQLAYFVKYSDRDELEKMALVFSLKTHLMFPDDVEVKSIVNYLFEQLDEKGASNYYSLPQFIQRKKILKEQNKDSLSVSFKDEMEIIYAKSVFADVLSSTTLGDALESQKKPFLTSVSKIDSNSIFMLPMVYVTDTLNHKKKYVNPKHSIIKLESLTKQIEKDNNLKIKFLSTYNLNKTSVEDYNTYALLSDWIELGSENENAFNPFSLDAEINQLFEKYNTKYLCVSGVYFYKNSNGTKFKRWLINTLLIPPVLGIIPGTVKLFKSEYSAYYSTYVFDLANGNVVVKESDFSFYHKNAEAKKRNLWNTLKPWYQNVKTIN